MTKFPSDRELRAYCADIGVDTDLQYYASPPDHTYKYYWTRTRQKTDEIILKRFHSTVLAADGDVLGFIKALNEQGKTDINYHYFNAAQALIGDINVSSHEPQFDYLRSRSIGRIEQHVYRVRPNGFTEEVPLTETPLETDNVSESLIIEYTDLTDASDDVLWILFLRMIAKGNASEKPKYYSIDLWRTADPLRFTLSEQRFTTGSHVITSDNFDYVLRQELLTNLKNYLAYHTDTPAPRPVKLTIIMRDADALSSRKAIEFVDESAKEKEKQFSVALSEYCYNLIFANLEQFNEASRELASRITADKDELAEYVLSDSTFKACSNRKLRRTYIENILGRDGFQKYKLCFRLTEFNDWLEQQHFTDELYSQIKSKG